ncbi:MAG: O-antigen ligase family protein [Candidatus Acidiferrales bacterium]
MEYAPELRNFDDRRVFSFASLAILAASLAGGFALFAFDAAPGTLLLLIVAVPGIAALFLYPEFALALYVVIGDVKGDDHVASLLPVDLTLVLGGILVFGIALNFLRKKQVVPLPPAYYLFLALLALMVASLYYTPVFDAGLEKLGRFLTVTGIVIVAPFFVLCTPQSMKRFLVAFAVAAFAICAYSLTALGGSERLVTPSSNTIGLGHIACALIILIWFALIPRFKFPGRIFTYLFLVVPGIALIGSGSRGPAIALAIVILISLFFYRRLLLDLACLAIIALVGLPFLHIPASALDYMGSLIRSRSVSGLLSFRGELLDYGWKLLQQHPLIGVGLQGYRYHSLNAAVYNWPHNIFLEIACELGIPAGLLVCVIFASSLREAFRQLKNCLCPCCTLSHVTAALLVIGIINAMNTGDINSDRSTWLFVSLVFVVRGYTAESPQPAALPIATTQPVHA